MYRAAWRQGLETTYYLATLGASNIEKATVDLKQGKPLPKDPPMNRPPNRSTLKREKKACSIQAMLNGEECEACQ